jgi:hypothetical protein
VAEPLPVSPAPAVVEALVEAPVAPPPRSDDPLPRGETFRRGIVLGPLGTVERGELFRREHTRLLDQAVAIGATDVQVLVQWSQVSPEAVELAPLDTVGDELLSWLIDQAHRRKLRVLLTPSINIEGAPDAAVGSTLAPASWERWWWSYSRFLLHYARVSVMRKVSTLVIGSGLTITEPHEEAWRKLIADARRIFKGELAYVATAESFERVGFWSEVDLIGIAVDARKAPSEEQLLSELLPLAGRIANADVARERGYLIVDASGAHEDAATSLAKHRALFQSFGDAARLRGMFVHDKLAVEKRAPKSARAATEIVKDWFAKDKS